MSENSETTKTSNEGEIRVPGAAVNPGNPASSDDLLKMQDTYFSGLKKEGADEKTPTKPETKKSSGKKEEGQTSLEESAQKFAKKAKETTKNTEEEPTGDDEFEAPAAVDMSQFLQDDSEDAVDNEDSEDAQEVIEDTEDSSAAGQPDSKTENIKKLRNINKNLSSRVAELEQQVKSAGNSSALQTEVQKLRSRVQELENYELVFGLHNNPKFKKTYIEGANNLVSEMQDIAKDYGIEDGVVDEILLANNRREIDEIVSEYFPSEESRRDVKSLKQKYDGLQKDRKKAEQAPRDVLQELHNKEQISKAERDASRDKHFKKVATSAWTTALAANNQLPDEQKIGELIEIPGKKAHNEKVVRPTLDAANQLANVGLGHIEKLIRNEAVIDEKFATWFMQICQQASATQMIHNTRQGLFQKYQELKGDTQKARKVSRPSMDTPTRSSGVKTSKTKKDGKQVAADIFEGVMKDGF